MRKLRLSSDRFIFLWPPKPEDPDLRLNELGRHGFGRTGQSGQCKTRTERGVVSTYGREKKGRAGANIASRA